MSGKKSDNGRAAAFFDLDRTLIDANSGFLFAKHEYRNKRIKLFHMGEIVFWGLLYHLSVLNLESAFRRALKLYRGVENEAIVAETHTWFEAEVAHRLQPGAKEVLATHRAQGDPLVVITNSSCYLAAETARAWQLDAWLSNHFVLDEEGRLTGDFEPPLCYGEGKIIRAERWAADHGVDLSKSTFYTDSYSDLPMLLHVGDPRVVNPDPRLKRRARREGWPILDWSKGKADR